MAPHRGLEPLAVAGSSVLTLERRAKLLLLYLDGDRGGLPFGRRASRSGGELVLALHLKIAGSSSSPPRTGAGRSGHPYPLPDVGPPGTIHALRARLRARGHPLRQRPAPLCLAALDAPGVPAGLKSSATAPIPLDLSFSAEVFAARLRSRRGRPIKAALLDQTCVAGLGNIYADEPARGGAAPPAPTGSLSEETVRLHGAVCSVLARAVPVGGGGQAPPCRSPKTVPPP